MKNCDVYLIVCEGQGDVDVGLVNEETWNWIFSEYTSDKDSYKEKIPETILNAYPKSEYQDENVSININSYDNDRALLSPKISFSTTKEAFNYITKNKCNLVDEFHGYIY